VKRHAVAKSPRPWTSPCLFYSTDRPYTIFELTVHHAVKGSFDAVPVAKISTFRVHDFLANEGALHQVRSPRCPGRSIQLMVSRGCQEFCQFSKHIRCFRTICFVQDRMCSTAEPPHVEAELIDCERMGLGGCRRMLVSGQRRLFWDRRARKRPGRNDFGLIITLPKP
jgi:hypothetical protein